MNTQSGFTSVQASEAKQVILELMKMRRFFLSREHGLDLGVFAECIQLDEVLRNVYKNHAAQTRQSIEKEEQVLGIVPPVLEDGKSIVKCSLYTGGLEICEVYPLHNFTSFIPGTFTVLYNEIFEMCHGDVADIKPRELSEKVESATLLSRRLWKELSTIRNKGDGIVVVMDTKFEPGFEVLKEKVENLVFAPYGLAYLFYKNECVNRTIEHNYVLFDIDEKNHTRLSHWSNEKIPSLAFGKSCGYSCRVKFVCLV